MLNFLILFFLSCNTVSYMKRGIIIVEQRKKYKINISIWITVMSECKNQILTILWYLNLHVLSTSFFDIDVRFSWAGKQKCISVNLIFHQYYYTKISIWKINIRKCENSKTKVVKSRGKDIWRKFCYTIVWERKLCCWNENSWK